MTQLAIIAGYLALLLGLGALASRMSRGTSRDYLLASHSIGPVLLLMSLFGTTMTAFALVGSTGKSYQLGIGVYGLMASSSGIVPCGLRTSRSWGRSASRESRFVDSAIPAIWRSTTGSISHG